MSYDFKTAAQEFSYTTSLVSDNHVDPHVLEAALRQAYAAGIEAAVHHMRTDKQLRRYQPPEVVRELKSPEQFLTELAEEVRKCPGR